MVRDPISVALSGDSPQNVIDRVSYLFGLATTTSELMESLDAALREAADHLGGLSLHLKLLEGAQEELLARQKRWMLCPREQMSQWVGERFATGD